MGYGTRGRRSRLERAALARARGWLALSVAIALTLLGRIWFVAGLLTPDLTPIHLPGLTSPSEPADLLPIL